MKSSYMSIGLFFLLVSTGTGVCALGEYDAQIKEPLCDAWTFHLGDVKGADKAGFDGSPGYTTYTIDPVKGDDANPVGKPWKTFGKINAVKLAPGDTVVIAPGRQEESLQPLGEGTADKPIVIRFLPGMHIIGIKGVIRLPLFISNSMGTSNPQPIPVGILVRNVKHLRVEGGGVGGSGQTKILYDGRMAEVVNDHSEDITFSGLVFDLKRPTVSEFRVLEAGSSHAVIQVAEGSDYIIKEGKFTWVGDWGPGAFCQEGIPSEGRCWRTNPPRGWKPEGQSEATATDLGGRKVRLEYSTGGSGLVDGHQYHFRNTTRDSVGVHNNRSKMIIFHDCDFYALTGMGFVSQFTEHITYQRVNVAPPRDTLRTCAAWGDIFQFSNCKGDILVESCRLSGMQDDAINCHGTYLRIVEKMGDNQLLVRFAHSQTYGFAAFQPGDEVAVICYSTLREYSRNPRRKVTAVEKISDRDWLLALDGSAPAFEEKDVLDNITWHPNITARNNHVSMDPVRGFLLNTPGRVVVEGNTFHRCQLPGILIESDADDWFESGPVRDVVIRNNQFIGCGISINSEAKALKPDMPAYENIRIEVNQFANSGISAKGVKGIAVTGNTFMPKVQISLSSSCTETRMENNDWKK